MKHFSKICNSFEYCAQWQEVAMSHRYRREFYLKIGEDKPGSQFEIFGFRNPISKSEILFGMRRMYHAVETHKEINQYIDIMDERNAIYAMSIPTAKSRRQSI